MLEYIILGFLMGCAASGYDLKQYMAESTSYFFYASYGSIYPALKRLEERKLILSKEKVTGGKFKKLYSITEEGRGVFLTWLKQPVRFAKTRLDYLVPFFFYEYLEPITAKQNLELFMETASVGLEELKAQKEELNIRNLAAGHTFHGSVLVYGIRYYEMLIEWCSQLAARTDERISAGSGKIGRKENAAAAENTTATEISTATDISTTTANTQKGGPLSENNHPRL